MFNQLKAYAPDSAKKYYKTLRNFSEKRYYKNRYQPITELLKQTSELNRIILIGTSVYGNLGDQAISKAEMTFLEDYFSNQKIIELPNAFYFHLKKVISEYIHENDTILINGGGFMGTLWPEAEDMARDLIQHFPNNKIVIFPQTIYFSPDENGKHQLEISKAIYKKHSNLTLFVRDKRSFEFAKEHFLGGQLKDIHLIPDIVTYLKEDEEGTNRSQILFCMRADKEKIDNEEQLDIVNEYLEKNNQYPIEYQDTVVDKKIDLYNREEELEKMLSHFKRSKLVITDRLHGMILSAITGTPCLALNNVSGKVKGAYEWIEFLDYISYVENIHDIPQILSHLLQIEETEYDNSSFQKYYDLLSEEIKN